MSEPKARAFVLVHDQHYDSGVPLGVFGVEEHAKMAALDHALKAHSWLRSTASTVAMEWKWQGTHSYQCWHGTFVGMDLDWSYSVWPLEAQGRAP